METRFFRFLVSQFMVSQDITKDRFAFVPIQDCKEEWTDEKLYEKYGITEDEQDFIASCIRPMRRSQQCLTTFSRSALVLLRLSMLIRLTRPRIGDS